ncbi:uncharacterized protein LOC132749884 [Ruditapes philippinarum]|uniref:uncharacterized protein LOC132749884 n=1 Tax=Ruditapes philippinarum TaxID=129788 RepID=UPI00295BFA8B|nr:uncharacterized protein LOC132749884 [Ruditapes philippinarum]
MNLIPLAIGIIAIFVQLLVQDVQADVGVRASSPLEIELLTIADYAAFNKFYKLTPTTLSHSKRVEMAKQNLTTWYTTMIHSTNLVYKGLEDHNIFISIKLVDFRIMTTEADSPWTETTKFQVDSTYYVDSDDVHPLFKATSLEYQKTVPHDHAMLFTGYELRHGPHGSNYAGNAYIAAECKSKESDHC